MTLALKQVPNAEDVWGRTRANIYDVTLDSSYPTGGYAIPGMTVPHLNGVKVVGVNTAGLTYQYVWSTSTGKLLVYNSLQTQEYNYEPGGGDIKGATAIVAGNATTDVASAAVNANYLIDWQAVSVIAGAVGSLGAITHQPDVARNVVISVRNATGGNLDLYVGTTTFTVTGTFRGVAQVETIALTVTNGQKTVAHAPDYRMVAGVKPFDSITTVTMNHYADNAATLDIGVGPGVLLGLPVSPSTGTDADIIKFTLNGADRSVATNFSYTNQTANVGTIADADDVGIVYKIGGQVPNATSLAGVVVRLLIMGY